MIKPNASYIFKRVLIAYFLLSAFSSPTWAFNSGSTGIDGAFFPNVNTTVQLPPDGILNYTTFNIPAGITVKFQSNIKNTPVYILVKGDAYIDGTIDISGISGDVLTSPPPGGYAGGETFTGNAGVNARGRGPGGGAGATYLSNYSGAGGSYATGTLAYGSSTLQPLLGGSGGGSTSMTRGSSGAGAILIASSGTLSLNGNILAVGGHGIETDAINAYHTGGGSGGAVRLVASQLVGSGSIDVTGGLNNSTSTMTSGGYGRIRLEADLMNFSGTLLPNFVTTSLPQPVFLATLPSVRITSIDGASAPVSPVGENDVILPSSGFPKTVTVQLAATDVPLGTTITVTCNGSTYTSTPLIGTLANSTATVDIYLYTGISQLFASVSFQ